MQIKYGTDEYGNVWHNEAQIEPVGGTVCYNPLKETLDEPITPDEGKRLIVENGQWKQIAIPMDCKKDGEIYRPKNQIERYQTGIDPIPKGMKLTEATDGKQELTAKTFEEQLSSGEITKTEYNTEKNKPVISELENIDIKSIRSIREWISKQSDCPEFLKTYEKEANEKRSGLLK